MDYENKYIYIRTLLQDNSYKSTVVYWTLAYLYNMHLGHRTTEPCHGVFTT